MARNEGSLKASIFKGYSFSEKEEALIDGVLERVHFKKGDILLRESEKALHQYYVLDGCLRTYFIDTFGKEHTVQFAIHDWWIGDYTAFFNASKAMMFMETLQEATLYKISRSEMERLFVEIPPLESFFRKKMEKAFAAFQKRILANLAQPAKERYLSFIRTYPNIEKSVKNYHIASYLGITTESLSRIRKELANR